MAESNKAETNDIFKWRSVEGIVVSWTIQIH